MPTNTKATFNTGTTTNLMPIDKCYVSIPNYGQIVVKALPDISDSKDATYSEENIGGRASPFKVYGYSNTRNISFQFHFYAVTQSDHKTNMANLRALASCVYPRDGGGDFPYKPPPVCQIKCGQLLADAPLCVILKSYSVNFPTDVAWDADTYMPFRFDVSTTWEVVYKTVDLPGSERILQSGR